MEDGKLLATIYERNSLEWFALRNKFEQDAKSKEGRELLELKRRECDELIELLKRHKRDLDWRAGEHKAETLYGSVELEGRFGDPGLTER